MYRKLYIYLSFLLLSVPASANQIDFTGGTAVMSNGNSLTTSSSQLYNDVDYYVENGFKLDFIGDSGSVGTYYSTISPTNQTVNDVIHGHWENGGYGRLSKILVTKTDGDSFDLNYFLLTSNTQNGGGDATGNERVYIHASTNGVDESYSQLLPSENWGFPATQILLGSEFDSIKSFWFTAENNIACFGMDNFYINEPPPAVPEPETYGMMLVGLSLIGFVTRRQTSRVSST